MKEKPIEYYTTWTNRFITASIVFTVLTFLIKVFGIPHWLDWAKGPY